MADIDAIKERHSVRNYTPEHIQAEKIVKLNEKIKELNEEGNIHLQLIEDAGNTYNRLFNRMAGIGSAPSVIACVGPDDETLEQRIGYYGEKLALLAPTAINQQKFLIRLNEDDSVEFVDKGGIFSQVDLGIVKCHFEIGSERKVDI